MKKIIAFIILVIIVILIISLSYNYYKNKDIKNEKLNKLKSDLGFVAVALTAITSLLLISALSIKEKFYGTTKPLIENVDSVANKAKAVLPDTTAVKTKILKAIKK